MGSIKKFWPNSENLLKMTSFYLSLTLKEVGKGSDTYAKHESLFFLFLITSHLYHYKYHLFLYICTEQLKVIWLKCSLLFTIIWHTSNLHSAHSAFTASVVIKTWVSHRAFLGKIHCCTGSDACFLALTRLFEAG